ncbi:MULTISPECIES: DNA adenine methylase [unclassified Roseofilum]|uniref:DNA adenine methylase n=1 Tax=unclassified Roseofilum TaxID=2620099 RepID=UPI000E89F57E|nr:MULTISPECIES: DNA adenine methylase [unclassified Roseofilum]HBR00702.1 modification methylase [Cyanobacteria bacterium UBA11691]MBP0009902.1 DNA adenine methylase [Roseofilum sp. Belize Diploria]MBP0015046.1 DNA adenine methylase [Roseofilum sp. SID3]MBP0034761.1 DNA adenine methylase [Roseofilum sp. Belize BBD 4]MBP0037991.1 DNA adenine methylase [Roseofilum sp. SID1]
MIKSPLRYPGGKARAIKKIIQHLPKEFNENWEYREPFVGGGALFIYLKQTYPSLKIWINDLNPELFLFWKVAQSDLDRLVSEVRNVKGSCTDGKGLFRAYLQVNVEDLSELERAVRFFVLNRISFSGTVESGGFSQQAFLRRFTDSSIDRLAKLAPVLQDVKITNLDYSEVLKPHGKWVFIFLDPPYLVATGSKLYGKDGNLHTSFEHQRFAQEMQACSHRWLITYDNSLEIRKNFEFAQVFEWELQYGMNNYKQASAAKGKELFITNTPNLSI